MPVGGSVRDHMVDGNTNKGSIDELRCLTRQQRELVAVVSDGLVVVKTRLNDQRYIRRSKNVRHPQIDGCMDESCTGAFLVIQEDDQRRNHVVFCSRFAIDSECNTTKVSTLQALSTVVWRFVTRARRQMKNQETGFRLAINNRRRLSPPLPDE
ncbi:hypothetical protein OSB04_005911 [Centaurea solstitialis]|uniref:Uncharacterized protein n=1 Tax=Centaurea solstitialis TaxID=347529 RepID=A0AA38WSD0_9ASTR|nr:hypothetical protein OSB04_005911 [Centaurea solstitialis]